MLTLMLLLAKLANTHECRNPENSETLKPWHMVLI